MISGFMIVKDVVKQGYPFVEAVASVLPICDEFLISEGYSSDSTFEIVEQLAKLNRKIKVLRQEWPVSRRYSILAEVTNALRRKCRFEYMFSIQANEIVHEDSLGYIRSLSQIFPNVQTFSFPFWHFIQRYKFYEDYRLRFSKNLVGIEATGDAWSLGLSKSFVRSEALKSLRHPRRLLRYFGRGIQWTYADSCANPTSRAVYLPKPVFRYWSLFPKNYLEKSVTHAKIFNLPEHYQIVESLEGYVDDPGVFWKIASEQARKGFGPEYPEEFAVVSKSEHPKLIQDLVSKSDAKGYYVREEVLDSIRDL